MRYDRDELLARTDLAALADELLGFHVGNGRNARWPSSSSASAARSVRARSSSRS